MKKKIIIKPKPNLESGAFIVKDGKTEPDKNDKAMKNKIDQKEVKEDVKQ